MRLSLTREAREAAKENPANMAGLSVYANITT
jgi:hypothetical protein